LNPIVVAAVSLLALINFRLLGGSRLVPIIHGAALQGALLALVGIALRELDTAETALAVGTFLVKGFVLPTLLLRALRQVEIRREIEPLVGYNVSLLVGAAALAIAAMLGGRIAEITTTHEPLMITISLFTMSTGLFLIVARRKAVTQALGYLIFENGIYGLGIAVASGEPLLVEAGILLDLFVAVFVMGIIIFHIQHDFSHIDIDRLVVPDEVPETVREGDPS